MPMTGSYRTYYVNQKTGRDSNDGLTMDSPFASLFQVNRLRLYPGDKVLLARDSVFTDQFLQIKDSGTREHPIEIGSYSPEEEGEGKNPLIAAGDRASGIRITVQHWIHLRMFLKVMYPLPYFYMM